MFKALHPLPLHENPITLGFEPALLNTTGEEPVPSPTLVTTFTASFCILSTQSWALSGTLPSEDWGRSHTTCSHNSTVFCTSPACNLDPYMVIAPADGAWPRVAGAWLI